MFPDEKTHNQISFTPQKEKKKEEIVDLDILASCRGSILDEWP
jgi:hypothetical protein